MRGYSQIKEKSQSKANKCKRDGRQEMSGCPYQNRAKGGEGQHKKKTPQVKGTEYQKNEQQAFRRDAVATKTIQRKRLT